MCRAAAVVGLPLEKKFDAGAAGAAGAAASAFAATTAGWTFTARGGLFSPREERLGVTVQLCPLQRRLALVILDGDVRTFLFVVRCCCWCCLNR